jgi:hypothetical protein
MYWPRLQLTSKEAARWAPYFDPNKLQRAVIYRVYNGEINLNTITKEDTENIQISRRARVLAMTASGDVHNVEIQIFDSGGEQYTMGFTPMQNMLLGANGDPRGMGTFNVALAPYYPARRISYGALFGIPYNVAPHIFDPNIVLDPNQTLSIKGRNMKQLSAVANGDVQNANAGTSHVSFCLHCWEFPVE